MYENEKKIKQKKINEGGSQSLSKATKIGKPEFIKIKKKEKLSDQYKV